MRKEGKINYIRWPLFVRDAAARFYRQSGMNAKVAGEKLVAFLENEAPACPGKFCRSCHEKWMLYGYLKDRPRPGRPRKVPEQLSPHLVKKPDANGQPILETLNTCLASDADLRQSAEDLTAHRPTLSRNHHRLLAKKKGVVKKEGAVKKKGVVKIKGNVKKQGAKVSSR